MKIENLIEKLILYVRRCLDTIVRVALGGTPPDAIDLKSLCFLYDEYDIDMLGWGLRDADHEIYVKAMGTEFFIPPFRGYPDWELLELKLERYKRGYRRDIRRVFLEGDD